MNSSSSSLLEGLEPFAFDSSSVVSSSSSLSSSLPEELEPLASDSSTVVSSSSSLSNLNALMLESSSD